MFSAPVRMWRRSPVLPIPIIRAPSCCVIRKHRLHTRRPLCRACLGRRGATARALTPVRAATRRATRDDTLMTIRRRPTCLWESAVARLPCRARRARRRMRLQRKSPWRRWRKRRRKSWSLILFSKNPRALWRPLLLKRTTEQEALCAGRPETSARVPLSRWMYYLFLSSSFHFYKWLCVWKKLESHPPWMCSKKRPKMSTFSERARKSLSPLPNLPQFTY